MKAYFQNRWRKWWKARLKAADKVTLHQRNVYIVPNGAGWMMALTIAVLLLTSVNYQLNLGYLLTFMAAGASFASIMVGHSNLRGISLQLEPSPPGPAGHSVRLQITCTNNTRRYKHAIALSSHEGLTSDGDLTWVSLAPGQSVTVGVRLPAMARGIHTTPLIRARTSFPLGLLRVWTVWQPASRLVIYPALENPVAALPSQADPLSADAPLGASAERSFDEIDGVRAYRPGDPPKTIVWKKVATAGLAFDAPGASGHDPQWVVRDLAPPGQLPRQFTLAQTGLADTEKALSRLCAWVFLAHETGTAFGLTLPATSIAPPGDEGQRDAHLRQCLEALAQC
jgi:uncharacterized protein (DUF58 family)